MDTDLGPTEFQTNVIRMTIDRFIKETNVREIVRKELHRKGKTATEERMEVLIAKYFDRRMDIATWWSCGLKHLEFRLCSCKRKEGISTRNVKIQKDIKTQSVWVQCNPDDWQDHHDPGQSIATQTSGFAEVRMSQLPDRMETQETQRNLRSDPLEASFPQQSSSLAAAVITIPVNLVPDMALTPTDHISTQRNSLPSCDEVIELNDSEPETSDSDNFVVLVATTSQTQHYEQASAEQPTNAENPSDEEATVIRANADLAVKDEPMEVLSITQINKKYAGDLVAVEISPAMMVINDTPNTQQMFEDIMEKPGSGNVTNSTMDFPDPPRSQNDVWEQTQNCKCVPFGSDGVSYQMVIFHFISFQQLCQIHNAVRMKQMNQYPRSSRAHKSLKKCWRAVGSLVQKVKRDFSKKSQQISLVQINRQQLRT